MSHPDRNNPYSFDAFLEWRDRVDYYADDPFIQAVVKTFTGDAWKQVDRAARKFSPKVSYRWRDMADTIAQPEKRPYVTHFDGHNHRIDRIERPLETVIMEKEAFSEGLFSTKTSPWEKLTKMFLLYQNGEACIVCPLTCTEGLVAILENFADTPELKRILRHCKEGIDGDFGIGAQYLSEIQGGSDVPANVLEAVRKRDTWRLYGTKFFCSATHADYAMEDFSSLPRLYRDAAVNELWEGPRNVLLAQIHRDLQKVSEWYPPSEFVQNLLPGADKKIVDAFSDEISGLVSYPGLVEMNAETVRICQQWDSFCARLFHAYQDLAKCEGERYLDNRKRD